MSTAKPQRTNGKPAQAEAPHEHTWEIWLLDRETQRCTGCYSFRRMVCDYSEHAAFADLLAACKAAEAHKLWTVTAKANRCMPRAVEANARWSGIEAMLRAAIAKAKPS